MGISSDGQICYGIAFEEDYHFPWMDDEWGDDPENWWFIGVCEYKPPFELYNSEGEYIDGVKPSPERNREYYDSYNKFKEANPMPVEIVGHCSYDYTMYIVAAPGSYVSSPRGDAVEIRTGDIDPAKFKAIIDFCEKYCKIEGSFCEFPEMKPGWLLSSMYG